MSFKSKVKQVQGDGREVTINFAGEQYKGVITEFNIQNPQDGSIVLETLDNEIVIIPYNTTVMTITHSGGEKTSKKKSNKENDVKEYSEMTPSELRKELANRGLSSLLKDSTKKKTMVRLLVEDDSNDWDDYKKEQERIRKSQDENDEEEEPDNDGFDENDEEEEDDDIEDEEDEEEEEVKSKKKKKSKIKSKKKAKKKSKRL